MYDDFFSMVGFIADASSAGYNHSDRPKVNLNVAVKTFAL
jgi:hypothetical protein